MTSTSDDLESVSEDVPVDVDSELEPESIFSSLRIAASDGGGADEDDAETEAEAEEEEAEEEGNDAYAKNDRLEC